ncbi:ParA family protein [Janthinobacterium sp. MDT1-19]|uniref:ParA family protein n=1 Tax=Janthinobacterium sp. MDT1-19 TaxID=1259339 RepID=UPI003F2037F9
MAKVLGIFNQKGGIGKSTFTVNIALYAAHAKIRTLIIENDAQKNSSNTVVSDVEKETKKSLKASMLFDENMGQDLPVFQVNPYLHIIPGDAGLEDVDSLVTTGDVAGRRDLYAVFKKNVDSLRANFDLIIIDTPTTAVHRYYSALVAADACVAPTTVDAFGMDGVLGLQGIIREVKGIYGNHRLNYLGVIPNKVMKRSALHTQTLQELKDAQIKMVGEIVYLRSDIENKLAMGKRSPAMRPAVDAILKGIM